MAVESHPAASDRDLASIQEARRLARRARQAQAELAEFSQEQIDAIVDAVAAAATPQAEAFARLAVEETGYGNVADKIQKNLFASERVYHFIRPMRTVGVIRRDQERKVVEIAEPFGVVAAIVPSTNPTSTTIYKVLIALKARCAIVLSPHPSAVGCISRVAEVLADAARGAGAPDGAVQWMTTVTLEGTQELMKQREVAVILATGGMGLVRAAYSAGKPAYGVGPGNAPAYIESSADLKKAVRDIVTGKTFDNGVLCSSENSVVVDEAVSGEVRREFVQHGGYFLSGPEMDALTRQLISPQRLPNPALVGKSARYIADKVGLTVPPDTRVLIAPLTGVGRDYPLSIREALPGALLLRREGLARGLRTVQADPALRRDGPYDGHPLAQRADHSRVRPEEAGVPHLREHPDDPRLDRPHDRPGTGDDAGLRRLRRQHHLRQHHAAPPAERQAAGLRAEAGPDVAPAGERDRAGGRLRGRPCGPCPAAGPRSRPTARHRRRTADAADRPVPAGTRHRRPGSGAAPRTDARARRAAGGRCHARAGSAPGGSGR